MADVLKGNIQAIQLHVWSGTMTLAPACRDPKLMNPRGCRQVGPGALTMMAYPMQRMSAFKQQDDRPHFFGLCLRVSCWRQSHVQCPQYMLNSSHVQLLLLMLLLVLASPSVTKHSADCAEFV